MSEGGKEAHPIGRDEMNLAELPIAFMTERAPKDCKTLIFQGRGGRLVITGSDAFGLPTAPDADVIVGLIQLTKLRNGFTDPTVRFTRYELLKLLGWPDRGQHYRRLDESLNRWMGVTLIYEKCGGQLPQVPHRRQVSHPGVDRQLRPGGSQEVEGEAAAVAVLVVHLEQGLLQVLPGRQPQAA